MAAFGLPTTAAPYYALYEVSQRTTLAPFTDGGATGCLVHLQSRLASSQVRSRPATVAAWRSVTQTSGFRWPMREVRRESVHPMMLLIINHVVEIWRTATHKVLVAINDLVSQDSVPAKKGTPKMKEHPQNVLKTSQTRIQFLETATEPEKLLKIQPVISMNPRSC